MSRYDNNSEGYTPTNPFTKGIIFRDRALKDREKSHWHCPDCGQEIHQDFVQSHKCNPLIKKLKQYPM